MRANVVLRPEPGGTVVANYLHQKLRDEIERLDTPPDDPTKTPEWLTGKSHLAFIEKVSAGEEIILAASGPCTYMGSVVVPASCVDEVPTDQRARWCWVGDERIAAYNWREGECPWIDQLPTRDAATWLEDGHPLAFQRSIEERVGREQVYWEPDQEFLHLSEAHWRTERATYARLTHLGDWLDVVTITNRGDADPIGIVTCNRDALDDYLVASESVLIVLFELDLRAYTRQDESSLLQRNWNYGGAIADGSLCYFTDRHLDVDFAITRGSSLIKPKSDRDLIAQRIRNHGVDPSDSAPISLLAASQWQDGKDGGQINPVQTTETFEATVSVDEDDLPTRYSPAFFNSEVLSRYTADPDRWSVAKGRIRCRGGWGLRKYSTNETGQVWALIEDLRWLPRQELEHWRQHNEVPSSPVTEADLRLIFFGELPENPEPLPQIRFILSGWVRADCWWWTLREDGALERLTSPIFGTRKAWGEAIVALDNVVTQGFNEDTLTTRLEQDGGKTKQKGGSIRLLEEILAPVPSGEKPVQLSAIRKLRNLRNRIGITHPRPDGGLAQSDAELARHGSYAAAYEHLCQDIVKELRQIEQALTT